MEPGGRDPHYDDELIGRLVGTIEQFEAGWTSWFADHSIVPCEVSYEELAADPLSTAHKVLDHLGLRVPPDQHLVVGHRRQADRAMPIGPRGSRLRPADRRRRRRTMRSPAEGTAARTSP